GEEPDPELRELQFLKNNYGPKAHTIQVRWQNGVFVPVGSIKSLDKMVADQKAEQVFLTMLGKFNDQSRNVSPSPSKTYAPTMFAAQDDAEGIKAKAFERAMSRLLGDNRIHIAEEGPPSHKRQRLVGGSKNR